MMSSKNNGFAASHIERYYSGKMLPEERHALEKAALDDPFLADALEGYAFTFTPSHDLAKIQSRLEGKISRKKIVPVFQRHRWLGVAAILLIIAGTAWFAYNISEKENKPFTTALEKKLPVNDSNFITASPQNILPGSANKKTSSVKQESVAKSQLKKTHNKVNQERFIIKSKEQSNKSNEKQVTENNNEELVSKLIVVPSTQNDVASANNRFSNAQRSNVRLNNAISPATRLNKASNNVERKELFLKKADANNANPAGNVRGINTNDTIKNLNIILNPLPADSFKEIVVGYGKQKKSTERHPHVIIDTLEPAEGYVSFDAYVANNLKMPEEFRDKPVSGEVQLSFDVGTNGQPTNITVVKSLCKKCDEEATRLLKEGPKWKKGKHKKGKITIKF